MARGRMLATTIATDKALNGLSIEAELLYLKTVPHLDRDGLVIGDADLLLAKVAPRRMAIFIDRMEDIICEWVAAGLALRYAAKDGQVLYFLGFQKNNSIRYDQEAPSTFPPPPEYTRTKAGLTPVEAQTNNVVTTLLPRCDNEPTPLQEPLKLKKGKEIQDNGARGDADVRDPDFARVCDAYHANIGLLTKTIGESLQDDLQEYGADWVVEALEIATKAEKRSLNYAEGILRKWRQNGKAGHNGTGKPHNGANADDPFKGVHLI